MDASRLTVTFAVLLALIGIGRFVLATVGRAGDGMASLFVPPDRALGWPPGVQEGDEPWGWRTGRRSDAGAAIAGSNPDPPGDETGGPPGDPPDLAGSAGGRYVVPLERVAPVRIGVRPH